MTIAGTGHNVRFKEDDMIRRSLRCRLTPDEPNPEDRPKTKLTEAALRRFFQENRQRCLSIALNTLRGYLHARATHPDDMPTGIDPKGFTDWAAIIQGCVLWLGRPDPLISQVRLREAIKIRSSDPVATMVHAWWKHWGTNERKARDFLDLMGDDPNQMSTTGANLREALEAMTDKPLKPITFKNILASKDDEVYPITESDGSKVRVRLHIFGYAGSNSYQLRRVEGRVRE